MSRRSFCICLLILVMSLILTACGKERDVETFSLAVETGDVFEIGVDVSRGLSAELDGSGILYFTDAQGITGGYLMFMTMEQVDSMYRQFRSEMVGKTIGEHEVEYFYAVLGDIPSAVAYQRIGNTGVAVVSGFSDVAIERILENISIKLSETS